MLALRLTVFCLLFCGTYGFTKYWFNFFNNCNAPETLVGKFCAALHDNDIDGDGDVDNKDVDHDLIMFNSDDDLCASQKWEFVVQWTCRFGWSEEYARFMWARFDVNGDGVMSGADFNAPILFRNEDFLMNQYTRFKNDYCSVPANRQNKIDRVLCAEVDALKPEDVKC